MFSKTTTRRVPRYILGALSLLVGLLAQPLGATTFLVDTEVDLPDGDILDNTCSWMADPDPNKATCSLRAAVMQANATPVDPNAPVVSIQLKPDQHYVLSIPPQDDDVLGANGDLDVFRPVAIGVASIFSRARIDIVADLERAFEFKQGATGSRLAGMDLSRNNIDGESGSYACVILAGNNTGTFTLDRISVGDTVCPSHGTAVFRNGTVATIRDSEFHHGNRAVFVQGGNVTLERTSVHSNHYGDNDAATVVASPSATLTIISSTFADNAFHVYAGSANLVIVGSTFTGANDRSIDFDTNSGGQLLRIQNSLFAASGDAPHCMFSGNSNGNASVTGSVFDDATCVTGVAPATPNLYNAQIALSALANTGGETPTIELQPSSDGIDWIPPQFCAADGTDQRGFPRAIDYSGLQPAHCDAGSTELQTAPPLPEGHIFGDGFED